MAKNKTLPQDIEQHKTRLDEISGMNFGALSDDEALELLAERKHLEALYDAYQERQTHLTELQAEEDQTEVAIEELNRSISPDKDDAALLSLITHRKELEANLLEVHAEIESLKKGKPQKSGKLDEKRADPLPEVSREDEKASQAPEEPPVPEPVVAEEAPPVPSQPEVQEREKEEVSVPPVEPEETPAPLADASKAGVTEEFGQEGISGNSLGENVDLEKYIDQLKTNKDSLGTILQGMPLNAKKNKAFMLEVARIDPAYAMHYADITLKKEEDFNVQVAGIKNPRNSGNALSEMLPEARTAKVVSAGVKQDYKNIRFATPQMEGYALMIASAKKRALEEIRQMKNAVDVRLLVPKPLQQDKAFMQEVEKAQAEGQAS